MLYYSMPVPPIGVTVVYQLKRLEVGRKAQRIDTATYTAAAIGATPLNVVQRRRSIDAINATAFNYPLLVRGSATRGQKREREKKQARGAERNGDKHERRRRRRESRRPGTGV